MATYKEIVAVVKGIKADTSMTIEVEGKSVIKKGADLKAYLMTLYNRPQSVNIELEEDKPEKQIKKQPKIKSDGESL